MSMEESIKRINELYHLSQTRELTPDEKEEQANLRAAYVASVRANLRGQLENIVVEDENGNKTDLKTYNSNLKNKNK